MTPRILQRGVENTPKTLVDDSIGQPKSQEELDINRAEQLISLAEQFDKRVTDLRDRSQRLLTLLFAAAAFIITPFLILPDKLAGSYVGHFYLFVGAIVIFLGFVARSSLMGMRKEAALHFKRSLFLYANAFDILIDKETNTRKVLTEDDRPDWWVSKAISDFFGGIKATVKLAIGYPRPRPFGAGSFDKTLKTRYSFGKSSLYSGFPYVVILLGVAYLVLGSHLIRSGQSQLPIVGTPGTEIQSEEAVDEQDIEQSGNDERVLRRVLRSVFRRVPV